MYNSIPVSVKGKGVEIVRLKNGMKVPKMLKLSPRSRYSTYKAEDGTIRVVRRGKPYKVRPFVSQKEMARRMKLEKGSK